MTPMATNVHTPMAPNVHTPMATNVHTPMAANVHRCVRSAELAEHAGREPPYLADI